MGGAEGAKGAQLRNYVGDNMSDLRKAAQQALEALEIASRNGADGLKRYELKELDDAITALRAALAQPELEPYKGDVTRIMRDAGMTFHLGLPHKAVIEQMTRVVDLVCAEASIKAAQKFAVALAQPEQLVVGGDDLPTLTKWTPQRKPLTDEEMRLCFTSTNTSEPLSEGWPGLERFARAIEKAHGIE